MTNIAIILLLLPLCVIFLSLLVIIYIFSNYMKEYKLKRKSIQTQNLISITDGKIINTILDNMIDDSINTYIILNIGYLDKSHIPEKQQKKMIIYIYNDIMNKISPSFRNFLSLIYHENYIDKEIKRRVELSVMSYIIHTNSNFNN